MPDDSTQSIVCNDCGREFATVENVNGKRRVTVHPPKMVVLIISKKPDVYGVECPVCEHITIIDTDLIKNL